MLGLVGAGILAGGCAAYAAYSFGWLSSLTQEDEEEGEEENMSSPERSRDEQERSGPLRNTSKEKIGEDPIEQLDVNAHLEHHFQSIQTIATETTISNLLIPLAEKIRSYNSIESTIHILKGALSKKEESKECNGSGNRKESTLRVEEKMTLWETVLEGILCRFLCVVWMVPMLHVQVRVQLNILGRTLYLQSSLEHHMLLTSKAQECFLSIGEYFGNEGCTHLLTIASRVSKASMKQLKKEKGWLVEPVTMVDINTLLSDALNVFEQQAICSGDWLQAILPNDDMIENIIERVDSPDDRHAVAAMWRETVAVMKQPHMSSHYLRICSKTLSRVISEHVGEKVDKKMPLVNTIPPLVNEVSHALDSSSTYFSLLSSMKVIQDMSARVYATGSL